MSPFDIVVVVLIAAGALAVIITAVYRKIKHKGTSCGCSDCAHCSGCSACSAVANKADSGASTQNSVAERGSEEDKN